MLAKRIIPCLDVDRGRVVKGINFLNLRDAGDPAEVAARYEAEGADELVLLDITASHEGREIMIDVVRRVSEQVFMPFTVGGGIRTLDDATRLIQAGAEKVSINSAAVRTPELVTQIARKFGSCATVVNIDPKRVRRRVESPELRVESQSSTADSRADARQAEREAQAQAQPSTLESQLSTFWEVHISGGRIPTGLEAVAWARRVEALGAGEIVLTSMDADGTQAGYDLAITRAVSDAVHIPVVASGGAGHPEHLYRVLTEGRADAALAASIFHYDQYSIQETKRYLAQRGVNIRLDGLKAAS